jgi:hypothetical protein
MATYSNYAKVLEQLRVLMENMQLVSGVFQE